MLFANVASEEQKRQTKYTLPMKNSKRRVCIIIVSHNRLSDLERCLESVRNALSPDDAAVVVDNHSHDIKRLRTVAANHVRFQWRFNQDNIGFVRGNHQGIKWALRHGFDYIFILNPDTEMLPKTIDLLSQASNALGDRWIIAPLLIQPGEDKDPIIDSAGLSIDIFYRAIDRFQGKRISQTPLEQKILPVDGLCGAAMFIPSRLFPLRNESAYAVFAEEYFAYFEDAEFSWHWKKQGHNFGVHPQVRVKHFRGQQSRLQRITRAQWRDNRFVIRKMILNRYLAIAFHETQGRLLSRMPVFFLYEIVRWLYILLRKPFLFPLFWTSWEIIFRKLIFNSPESTNSD